VWRSRVATSPALLNTVRRLSCHAGGGITFPHSQQTNGIGTALPGGPRPSLWEAVPICRRTLFLTASPSLHP